MSTRTRAAGILTAITMTALVAACSSSDDSASDTGTSESSGMSAEAPDAPGAVGRELGDGADTTSGSDSGSVSGSKVAAIPEMERSIIATGAISLTSKDVAETRREVQRIVDAQGGDVTEENTETDDDGDTSYARLVIRVPSSEFGTSMVALEKAGDLRSSTRGSDDVTTQVIDTGVRVRAQEASLKRVELLLAEARSLKDIIWIESQLTSRQAELDSLKSQQSWLADQTSLSTITVAITHQRAQVKEEKPDDEPAGFLSGLKSGMDALGASFAAVATIVGALLPFAAVALVLGLPVWLVVRRRRAAPAVPQAPAA
ncbi:protein of unknown function [Nocardioides alpinus]|uniref:DUF4349 domain-containing protein n=1 Tax=Nocardioides alpinus TaxID=748909 RepID=A0A1I0VU41_9ACTN|nr:DUF4349 domain-containing protein [Nocardioides alpinus]PKH37484.1 DUF4349 domain-containing protein [Nocardioides alpinus]SFA79921.1 protein of unknown function [Nocardioides alpinus]